MSLPTYPEESLAKMKQEFDDLLYSTSRDGIKTLIEYLESTDFYTAPASANGHGNIYGGLIRHSLQVCRYLQNFLKPLPDEIRPSEDSQIIAGLLHDLCKVDFYTTGRRNVKNEHGRWEEVEYFQINDEFPLGHGEKSVFLAQRYIALSNDEALAIRWHMGGYDDAARSFISGKAQSNAYDITPLAPALHIADMYVARLLHE